MKGDVSWIWDVDVHYGSHIHHNHDPDPCYLEGTKILTLEGWKTVENLKVGDQVTVYKADGEVSTSPITWVGKGQAHVLNAHHIDDRSGYPVRVSKNAIAEGVPYTDLLVTPEHMLCIKDVFIPVRCLVNHFSIYYDSTIPDYTYYHFTTETHSVVNANGILSETYLGGQHQWDDTNIHMVVKDAPSAARPIVTSTAFLAQLQADILRRCDKGEHTEDALLSDRVFSLTLRDTDGHIVHALRSNANTHVFMIPRTRNGLFHLDVPVHRPVDLFGPSVDDRRYLGARMEFSIIESDGQITPLHMDYPSDTSWYPDGWSKSGSRITLPEDARMLSVKVIEHVWDMDH